MSQKLEPDAPSVSHISILSNVSLNFRFACLQVGKQDKRVFQELQKLSVLPTPFGAAFVHSKDTS